MDFFESQDAARKKTGLLVAYFLLAVALIVLALYFAAVMALGFADPDTALEPPRWWHPQLFAVVAAATLLIIGLGSLYKTLALSGGGENVATMLGGTRIHPNTTDLDERRLLNVVEEMALASGTPVPPVFLLKGEQGINAFAAGLTPSDAVIGVNRGTLQYLNRDELQGVMAHEFSHILNGDMRLNIRLMGILHGILLIALIGYYLLRFGGGGARYAGRRDSKGAPPILLLGVAALVVGYIGLFFGRLIKAAVSRQREYLADASAVQFTRNPDGIAGALKKIGGLVHGSQMTTPEAESASHLFFGSGLNFMFALLATHPPLKERIARIDPGFDGRFLKATPRRAQPAQPPSPPGATPARKAPPQRPVFPFPGAGGPWTAGQPFPLDPAIILAAVGHTDQNRLAYAAQLLDSMPKPLVDAVHEPFSARAVVFALLLSDQLETQQNQLRTLGQQEPAGTVEVTQSLAPIIQNLGLSARLPIVDIVQSTLRGLAPGQYQQFRHSVQQLVSADQRIDLLEFILQRIVVTHLDRHFGLTRSPRPRYVAIRGLANETTTLLSTLAYVGHPQEEYAARAFHLAVSSVGLSGQLPQLPPRSECTLKVFSTALDQLAQATPAIKKRVLSAAMVSAATDGHVTVAEAELLRAVAESLDCPIPPIVAGPVDPQAFPQP